MGFDIKVLKGSTTPLLNEVEYKKKQCLQAWASSAHKNAVVEINNTIYDTPEVNGYVRTGRLRNSLTSAVSGDTMYVGTNVEYAKFQELGTSKGIKPKHFLSNSLNKHLGEYKAIMEATLKG